MAIKKYVSPEGFSVDTLEVFPAGGSEFMALVIQYNEDRSAHRSEVHFGSDFAGGETEKVFDVPRWVYSLWRAPSGSAYVIHSGGVLERGRIGSDFAPILSADRNFTRLFAAHEDRLFITGIDGYVGLFDGTTLTDLPVTDAEDVYCVSVTEDGAVYASGNEGGLWRLEGSSWSRIELPVAVDIYSVVADGPNGLLLCGEGGFCGRLIEGELVQFEADEEKDYYCMTRYRSDLYVGAGFRGVDRLNGNSLETFKDIAYAYYISSDETYLFTSGLNRIGRFDGSGWLKRDFT